MPIVSIYTWIHYVASFPPYAGRRCGLLVSARAATAAYDGTALRVVAARPTRSSMMGRSLLPSSAVAAACAAAGSPAAPSASPPAWAEMAPLVAPTRFGQKLRPYPTNNSYPFLRFRVARSTAVFAAWLHENLVLLRFPDPRESLIMRPSAVLVRAASMLTTSLSSST